MAHTKTKSKSDYLRDTQTIDAAWAMVQSLKGWDIAEWDDPAIQRAAMQAAELFIKSVKDRLPSELK